MTLGIPIIAVNYCCWHYPLSGGCYKLLAAHGIIIVGIIIVGCSWHYYCWLMALLLLAVHGIIIVGSWHYYCWLLMALLLSGQWQ